MKISTFQEFTNYISIYGNKTACQMRMNRGEDYTSYTYNEVSKIAKQIAAYLEREKHLKKGNKVAIFSENRPEWIMAYLGITYNGIWAVPLDARLSELEVKNLLLDSGAGIIFVSRSLYETLSGSDEILAHIHEFIIFDDIKTKDKNVKSFAQVLEKSKNFILKDRKVNPEDVASLIYTSGTTGNPKGVMLTHSNIASQYNSLPKAAQLGSDDTILSLLPLHHTFEFSIEMTIYFSGGSITYAESFKPKLMFANIEETNVTIMIGVPLLYEKIYDGIMRQVRNLPFGIKHFVILLYGIAKFLNPHTHNKTGKRLFGFLRKKASLNGVRFMISGAAPLNHKVAEGFNTLGITLLNGYGLTETSPVLSVNPPHGKINNYSVGPLIEGVKVKISNPDEQGNGEILVKGSCVMKGYYHNEKATKATFDKDGWLLTGDIGHLDKDNYLYVTGRSKNIIVTSGGKNVYPEEIEEEINNSEFILESIVIGVPQGEDSKGELIYAYVVPDYEYFDTYTNIQGIQMNEEFVKKMIDKHMREINRRLSDYKKIRNYRVRREEFPKTSTKKIKRYLFSGKDFLTM